VDITYEVRIHKQVNELFRQLLLLCTDSHPHITWYPTWKKTPDSSRPSFCTHFYVAFRHQHTSRQPRKQKTIYWFKNAAPAGESSRPRIKQKHIDLNSSTLITRRIHTTHKQAGNTLSSPLPLRRTADGYYCAHPYQLISHTSCHSTERFITVITKRKDNHITNNYILRRHRM